VFMSSLPDSEPSLDETLDGSTEPIKCGDRFRVLILDSHLPDFKCHLGLSLRSNHPNDFGGALQTPRREQGMSRQIHHDANYVIRSQDPRDLRRIKSHEDSGSADVDYSPGKLRSLRRDRARAATQPQAETASASPFNGSLSWFKDLLESAPVEMCCRHGRPLRPCGPPIVLCTRWSRTEPPLFGG